MTTTSIPHLDDEPVEYPLEDHSPAECATSGDDLSHPDAFDAWLTPTWVNLGHGNEWTKVPAGLNADEFEAWVSQQIVEAHEHLRKLRIQAESLCSRLFSRQGFRVTDLNRRARLRAMRRHNAELDANPIPGLLPYLPEHFAAIRAEMGDAQR